MSVRALRIDRGFFALCAALLPAGLLPGCSDTGAAEPPLLVMAAANLDTAMPVLVEEFETSSRYEVDVAFASTGSLAAQIENGAPADLFLSADLATVERLAVRGRLWPETVAPYARGSLVLVWRQGIAPPVTHDTSSALGALATEEYRTISIANPEHAPYGTAAKEALETAGIWQDVRAKIVFAENVVQALQFVRTGNTDAAIVARSVMVEAGGGTFQSIDSALHAPVIQGMAILERSAHPGAELLRRFVLGEEGQAILARYGFEPAADGSPAPDRPAPDPPASPRR